MFKFLSNAFTSFFSIFSKKENSDTNTKENEPDPFEKSTLDYVEIDTPTEEPSDINNLFGNSSEKIEGIEDGSA
jgi:hypothetical protein